MQPFQVPFISLALWKSKVVNIFQEKYNFCDLAHDYKTCVDCVTYVPIDRPKLIGANH